MKPKRWMIAEPDAGGVRRLTQEIHCAPLAAAVLSARGIENADAARAFLSCDRSGLHDPHLMRDMDKAVEGRGSERHFPGFALRGKYHYFRRIQR